MIDLTKGLNIELILSNIDNKELLDKVREYDVNYFYGQFYKKSIRMKKVLEKVS